MRAVLHAHSTWSYDGQWPLERIARLYGALGVDAVLMSEHDTGFDPQSFPDYRAACAAASTRRCRLIPGIEYSSPENDIHILTWGLDHFLAEHRPVQETLERITAAGGVAIFAHPIRRQAWRQFDPVWTPFLSGIELWNRKSDGLVWGAEALTMIQNTGLPATVGQDFHRLKQLYPLTMRFDLPKAGSSAREMERAIVTALAEGRGQPQAFRRALLTATGTVRPGIHARLERARKNGLARLRRKRR